MRTGLQQPSTPTTIRRLAALVLLVGLLLTAWPPTAHAHAELIGSTPQAGDTVGLGTDRVVLVFSEELTPGQAQVLVRDVDGNDVAAGEPTLDGPTLEVPLRLHRAGPHTVAYRVLSVDGHTVVGELGFGVRDRSDTARTATPSPTTPSASAPALAGSDDAAPPAAPAAVGTPVTDSTQTWVPAPLWWLAGAGGLLTVVALLMTWAARGAAARTSGTSPGDPPLPRP